jgi:hypothetical protein
MQMGLVPIWGIIFLPNLIIFLAMTHYVEGIPWITVIFSLLTGIAYVMCFLNGVASTNRMKLFPASIATEPTIHAIFRALQRVSWASAIGWGVTTIGILRRPDKDWVRIVALGSGILAIVTGYPVAVASSLSFEKLSMFFMAPILSTLLVLVPLFPRVWNRLVMPQKIEAV